MSRQAPPRNDRTKRGADRHSVQIDGETGTVTLESELSVEIQIDRQIQDGRGLMVGILAAREAARLMRLPADELRALYERSVR